MCDDGAMEEGKKVFIQTKEEAMKSRWISLVLVVLVLGAAMPAAAELPWQFAEHTRYMALGDSLTAGYGAIPQTNGYAYVLYKTGAVDSVPNTLFTNSAVPGMTSWEVMNHQVPQAAIFKPDVVTLTVGGNDLLTILNGADPEAVLTQYGMNLSNILVGLCTAVPDVQIYVGNLYTVPLPNLPDVDDVVIAFNEVVEKVVSRVNGASPTIGWGCGIGIADLYSAFQGQSRLLLIERNQADPFEIHPTNAGYKVMAKAFRDAMAE
jgi:lysophospholipase L1-like esterase